jgi:hypothetical protein
MEESVADRYRRFAAEAAGRSPLYAEWAAGVAADEEVCGILARIPANRRQAPLVFAVTRMQGAPLAGYGTWRAWLLAHADAVVADASARSLQTNEPLRCAALLPALSLVDGPIALLEVGASAGLCLLPDLYRYEYTRPDAAPIRIGDPDAPVLRSRLRGPQTPALRLPEVVWRAGIDLHPLDARNPADRAFLTGLVWPGETGRAERIAAALDVAAAHPPRIVAGDAGELIPALAAEAPADATLVVTTPGVLPHVARAGRERIVAAARDAGRWITLDPPGLGTTRPPAEWPEDGFVLALDGEILGAADPLGEWVEWRAG